MRPLQSALSALVLSAPVLVHAAPQSPHVRVDQLGYRPRAEKVGVLRAAVVGYDAPLPYTAPAAVEIRRTADGSLAFSAPAVAWDGGAVHGSSGDRVWWFDFSALSEEGEFETRDPLSGATSEPFRIDRDVYDGALRAAARMFLYQRCGAAKAQPFAESPWTDTACHLGAEQDTDCRAVLNPVPSTSKDLSGGWHDAGDYNKYVNFADDALHDLLGAFELDPLRWPDDWGLLESGNGVPDVLDLARVELAWFQRMQASDGSVLHKVSGLGFDAASPPSADTVKRRYAPSTASATVSAAGAFARGALAFGNLGDAGSQAFAAGLETAAVKAWAWLEAHPSAFPSHYDNAGFASAPAEDDPYEQEMNRLRAAVFLFRLTGEAKYKAAVDAAVPQSHLVQWTWAAAWEHTAQDGMLAYLEAPGATPATVELIRARFVQAVQGALAPVTAEDDAYRAFLPDQDYVWGSNRTKARQALLFAWMLQHGLDAPKAALYRVAAEDYAHGLHGLNPPGLTYLTNLSALGAGASVNETYHSWFGDGTPWDSAASSPFGPAPGILTGGPNPFFAPDPAYVGPPLVPPQGQPEQKSYRDWNTSWPENSWEVTECSITYQASYVRFLARYAVGVAPELALDATPILKGGAPATFTLGGAAPGAPLAVLWSGALGQLAFASPAWTVDLGLDLSVNPSVHLLFLGAAGAGGTASWTVGVPPGLQGIALHFQATQAGTTPYPSQSSVLTRVGQ